MSADAMSVPRIGRGEILPLVRRLNGAPDPLALYAGLTDGGRRPHTLLLESADSGDGTGQRSLLVVRSMLRLTCRGRNVAIEALTRNGAALGGALALEHGERKEARLHGCGPVLSRGAARSCGAPGFQVARKDGESSGRHLQEGRAEAPVPTAGARRDPVAHDFTEIDERTRLLAPGPLDVLRSAVLKARVLSDAGPFSHLAAGILGYDLVDHFESLPVPRADADGFPDYVFWIPDRAILVDHLHGTTTVFALVAGGRDVEASYHDAVRDVERLTRAVAEIAERLESEPVGRSIGGHSSRSPARGESLVQGPRATASAMRTDGIPSAPAFLAAVERDAGGHHSLEINDVHAAFRSAQTWPPSGIGRAETAGGFPVRGGGRCVQVDITDEDFAGLVRRLQEHVAAGDVFQIVPSRTFTVPCEEPLGAYSRLRAESPTPYQFFIRAPEFVLLGASPEMAVRVEAASRMVTIRPIAGTVPRARTRGGDLDAETDARYQAALLTSSKEISEHLMLVDLARNDVARVSRPGSRVVSRLLALEGYRSVSHLVSEVTGELAEDLDALHAYAASLNMGTLVGAPKVRAAQLLRLHETTRRGAYGGAVGILTHDGSLDTAIVIRAAYVREGRACVRAGAGVVLDSNPESEAEETRLKAAAVLHALGANGAV